MLKIYGKGASPGVCIGPLYFYKRQKSVIEHYKVEDVQAEWQRFLRAREEAVDRMGQLAVKARAETGERGAALLEIQQMIAHDEDFEEAIRAQIQDERNNAESALCDTSALFMNVFTSMDNEYMQARAADVRDVTRSIIDVLLGRVRGGIDSEVPVILTADDLGPSETIQLDKSKLLGIVTSGGSPLGHTAILARTMGIPAVLGIGDVLKPRMAGQTVILDGETGLTVVQADKATRAQLVKKYEDEQMRKGRLERLKGKPNITLDGQSIKVACNITSPADLPVVAENDGDGVGLFRSEFLYLSSSDYPTEETQFEAYRQAVEQMPGRQVIIRTLDIGADKQVDYFGLSPETNPAMGMRALRICLTRPGVFRTQLRALYRASAFGQLAIMFPLVSSVWELREARRMCRVVMAELEEEGIPYNKDMPLGIMIETPAAVLISDRLAREADFFSVGTNDLIQYTTACDRQSDGLGRFYDPHHPAVLRGIKTVVENAHKRGIWVGICGELASDPAMTPMLLALGVDELSVSPSEVLKVRDVIRSIDMSKIKKKLIRELMSEKE